MPHRLVDQLLDAREVLDVRQLLQRRGASLVDVVVHHLWRRVLHHPQHSLRPAQPRQDGHVSGVLLLECDRLEVLAIHGRQQPQLGQHLQPVDHVGGERRLDAPEGGVGGAPLVPLHREDDMRVDLRDDGLRDMEELREAVARDVLREGAVDPLRRAARVALARIRLDLAGLRVLCEEGRRLHHRRQRAGAVHRRADEDVWGGERVEEQRRPRA
mmetsp:Transcript_8622/g.28408  ORF Transcript_8622/g.28408 Transcript_8622/m.28408 type:complete len:214 (-) Transcript_8622:1244-1885(-)